MGLAKRSLKERDAELPGEELCRHAVVSGSEREVKKLFDGLSEEECVHLVARKGPGQTGSTLLHLAAGHFETTVSDDRCVAVLKLLLDQLKPRLVQLHGALPASARSPPLVRVPF